MRRSALKSYCRFYRFLQICLALISVSTLAIIAGCGGGKSAGTVQNTPTTTYTIGGSVSGLSGSGLVLQNNGGNNQTITANGSFTFSTAVSSGGAYSVTVLTQPSSPTQTCSVANGSGTATANVTNVQVTCAAPTYTIGGTVSGLSGSGLVLQNNGGNNLTITANGNFTFTTAITSGSAYAVTVLTQPSNPTQNCTVTNGSGTASANVTNVQVACVTPPAGYTIGGTVTGLSGAGLMLQDNGGNNLAVAADGSFTFTTAITSGGAYSVTVSTQPATPAQTCTVTNGVGTATANVTNIAVACKFNNAGEWAWMAGSNSNNAHGTYGTEGTAAAANSPGARSYSTNWTDSSGNLWLFGGSGYDSAGTFNPMNDLWKWNGTAWTWVGGSNVGNQQGVYGTQGTGTGSTFPGARSNAMGSVDASGNFWLFAGDGTPFLSNTTDLFNDLWKYSGGVWTWVSGSSGFNNVGVYGTQGTAAATNAPGARKSGVSWTDQSGNVWIFGGSGLDSVGTLISGSVPPLGDLWKFTVSSGQWTWMKGSNTAAHAGVYGTMGTGAAANTPGARTLSCSWTDKAGNLWLFGGSGYDSAGATGVLNDLWEYSVSNNQWTWISGANVGNQAGVYGTLGTPAAANVPGGRYLPACWMDAAGNFWIFGGYGADSTDFRNWLSDLWEYSNGQWTWMGGPNVADQAGTYGTLGTPAAANIPGSRYVAASWSDKSGNFWTFGGFGQWTSPNTFSNLNDMWEYLP